jgi:hypothetical protein
LGINREIEIKKTTKSKLSNQTTNNKSNQKNVNNIIEIVVCISETDNGTNATLYWSLFMHIYHIETDPGTPP